MESGTGSTVSRTSKAGKKPVRLEHHVGGGNKKHDIGQAPPCGHTRPNTTTENYPIPKGKGHEACGACGGGGGSDDDDDDKEHKLWACSGWGTDHEGDKEDTLRKPAAEKDDDTLYCDHCDKLFLDKRSYKTHMASNVHRNSK